MLDDLFLILVALVALFLPMAAGAFVGEWLATRRRNRRWR